MKMWNYFICEFECFFIVLFSEHEEDEEVFYENEVI